MGDSGYKQGLAMYICARENMPCGSVLFKKKVVLLQLSILSNRRVQQSMFPAFYDYMMAKKHEPVHFKG